MKQIAIIGAGIAGLRAAHLLQPYAHVTLFEKARGVGGRMSTRRAEPYAFNHGAQYFTARSDTFQQFLAPLIARGLIARWNARCVTYDGTSLVAEEDWASAPPRYVALPGMNQLAKHMAQGLDVQLCTQIARMAHRNGWHLYDDSDTHLGTFDWVIVTAPAPQAAALLPNDFAHYDAVRNIQMRACFALMLGFKTPLPVAFDAARLRNSDLSWIAAHARTPDRAGPFTLVAHASAAYAEAHIDDDRDAVTQHLCDVLRHTIGHDINHATYATVHGWRYANTASRTPLPPLLDNQRQLAACGDWCEGGRVEGAFTSATHIATRIEALL
jgi:renalase